MALSAVLKECYSEVTAYAASAYSVFTLRMDAKVMPIDDILRGEYTHTYIHTDIHGQKQC